MSLSPCEINPDSILAVMHSPIRFPSIELNLVSTVILTGLFASLVGRGTLSRTSSKQFPLYQSDIGHVSLTDSVRLMPSNPLIGMKVMFFLRYPTLSKNGKILPLISEYLSSDQSFKSSLLMATTT